jgi:hypothetical protein
LVKGGDTLAQSVVDVRWIVAIEGAIDGVGLAWVWRDDACGVSDGTDGGKDGNRDGVWGVVEVDDGLDSVGGEDLGWGCLGEYVWWEVRAQAYRVRILMAYVPVLEEECSDAVLIEVVVGGDGAIWLSDGD